LRFKIFEYVGLSCSLYPGVQSHSFIGGGRM